MRCLWSCRWWTACLLAIALWALLIPSASVIAEAQSPSPRNSEEADGPLQVWRNKNKFFLVIAVDQTGVAGTELPFAAVDGEKVAKALQALEYKPLLREAPVLREPTSGRVTMALKEIRKLPERATVIVYYSGHGVTDPQDKDVWLQLAGQPEVGDHLGISVGQVVETARGATFLGELHVVVDACFSGRGAHTGALTLKEFGHKTTILTSSTERQTSFPIIPPGGSATLSAFTHTLLEAWGPDWSAADDNSDGILRFNELVDYSTVRLQRFYQDKAIPKAMRPQLIGTHDYESFVAYRRDRVRQWTSQARTALLYLAVDRKLSPAQALKPEIPATARLLAEQIPPTESDPYVQAQKALAEGRLPEAHTLFTQAAAQEAELQRQEGELHTDRFAKIYLALGRTETYAGRFKASLPWYQKTAALKRTRDPALLDEFGLAWLRAGRYEEARPFLEEALDIRTQSLSSNDPDFADSFNNLGLLYAQRDKYAEAEPLYQRALQIDQAALGPDHPAVARDVNNLAALYRQQGKYAEAEPLFQRAYYILKRQLGLTHPTTKAVLKNYASFLFKHGERAKLQDLDGDLRTAFPEEFRRSDSTETAQ